MAAILEIVRHFDFSRCLMSSIKSNIRQKQDGLIRAFCDSILSFYSKKDYFRTAMAAILNIGRHFEFLRWLTGFLKRATPKEDVCQFWCLYPEVNYSPDICMLAAPLIERSLQIQHFGITLKRCTYR